MKTKNILITGIVLVLVLTGITIAFREMGEDGSQMASASPQMQTLTEMEQSPGTEQVNRDEEIGGLTTVEMANIAYQPQEITVSPGDIVRWENKDSVEHTITGFGIDVTVMPGESFEHTFFEKGTHEYECTIHPNMTGRVIVE